VNVKTSLVFSHMAESALVRKAFEEKAEKIAKYLKRFKEDQVQLRAALDKNPHLEEFSASLSLRLPDTTIHASERARDFGTAFNEAFLDLVRQLRKHKDKLIREKRRQTRYSSKP
jgi:ribosomal subunit interface protein